MRQRILITGGGGFVGRALVRLLMESHDVCVMDTLRFGLKRFSPDELGKIRLEQVDIRDAGAVMRLVQDFAPEVTVHLAAVHFIPECESDPQAAVATNVLGTVNLLMAVPEGSRFVYASSGAVYSPSSSLHVESSSQVGPMDVYGFTKLHGEQLVGYFGRTRSLSSVVVRLFNVVGPGETNPHLMPEIVAQLKSGRSVVHLGNIWPKRDYIHVVDAATGFEAVATAGKVEAGNVITVNLGTSQQYSVEDVLGRLRIASGRDFQVYQDPSRVRAVDRAFLGADISAIARVFSWAPAKSIDDAVRDLWEAPDMTDELLAKYRLTNECN